MKPFPRLRQLGRSLTGRHAERWRLGAAAALLAAGLLRPTLPATEPQLDAIVVLDITQSMNVQDYVLAGEPASRLAYAKHALAEALRTLPCGSRLGWAIFTEYRSYLLFAPVEVCAHLQELRATLADIDGRMAWASASEIAKGLYSGIAIAAQLPDAPALLFVSDGHEAPPVDPRYRPRFDGQRGAVRGLVVGAGGLTPLPIPKFDPQGRPLGFWRADEVLQRDPHDMGRGGSVPGEAMVADGPPASAAPAAAGEQLSALHETYLQGLAEDTGLGYQHLASAEALAAALRSPALTRPGPARTALWPALAAAALLLLLAPHAAGGWRRAAQPGWSSRTR